jgi:parvulin-like peptidyl-prolyl isomerase
MGNEVFAGRRFADVARAESDGVTANDGGRRNWTSRGSLVCKALDNALFGLPVGMLSPVIKSANGFHIIRVTDREDAAVTTFLQAQAEIKDKIVQQRTRKQTEEYIAELKAKTPVWTVFDERPDVPQMASPPRGEIRR